MRLVKRGFTQRTPSSVRLGALSVILVAVIGGTQAPAMADHLCNHGQQKFMYKPSENAIGSQGRYYIYSQTFDGCGGGGVVNTAFLKLFPGNGAYAEAILYNFEGNGNQHVDIDVGYRIFGGATVFADCTTLTLPVNARYGLAIWKKTGTSTQFDVHVDATGGNTNYVIHCATPSLGDQIGWAETELERFGFNGGTAYGHVQDLKYLGTDRVTRPWTGVSCDTEHAYWGTWKVNVLSTTSHQTVAGTPSGHC